MVDLWRNQWKYTRDHRQNESHRKFLERLPYLYHIEWKQRNWE